MNLSMKEVKINNSLTPYMEELELVDDLSGAEVAGYICGIGVVGGGVWGIIAGGIKIAAAT